MEGRTGGIIVSSLTPINGGWVDPEFANRLGLFVPHDAIGGKEENLLGVVQAIEQVEAGKLPVVEKDRIPLPVSIPTKSRPGGRPLALICLGLIGKQGCAYRVSPEPV